jgi:hypothetical protein
MKIWRSYGSEHSANLVMIGSFESEDDARKSELLFSELNAKANEEHTAGRLKDDWTNTRYSDELLRFLTARNIMDYGFNDAALFLYEHHVRREGTRLILTTEESEVSAFLKLMLKGGAKVEIYSAHDHPGKYGRGR